MNATEAAAVNMLCPCCGKEIACSDARVAVEMPRPDGQLRASTRDAHQQCLRDWYDHSRNKGGANTFTPFLANVQRIEAAGLRQLGSESARPSPLKATRA